MEPIIVSLVYYCCVVTFCELSRRFIDVLGVRQPILRHALFEFFGTLQVCTCVYENHLVTKNFGLKGFFLVVFLLLNIHRMVNRGAFISPAVALERLLSSGISVFHFVVVFWAQILGALCAFRLARRIWWIELSETHAHQAVNFDCVLSFKGPVFALIFYEFCVCFVLRTCIGIASRKNPRFSPILAAVLFATALSSEILFFGVAGLNPIIAFSRLFGCKGLNNIDHFVIFWFPAITGWLLAFFIDRSRIMISGLKKD
uniref:Aquaporin n=1 Tax=Romanomermis culicivorax TaxID=13658 RepID=A0A915JLK6_ROMCU